MHVAAREIMADDAGKQSDWWGLHVEALEDSVSVSMSAMSTMAAADYPELEYSVDEGEIWSPFVVKSTTVSLAHAGDRMLVRAGSSGNTCTAVSASACCYFVFTGEASVGGNLLSLLSQSPITELPSGTPNYVFARLFSFVGSSGQVSLVDASALVLSSAALTPYCYYEMFSGDDLLVGAPELPALALASNCYQRMFYQCRALMTAPALPAATLQPYCYYSMFDGCWSLTTAPELPARSLATYCYSYMFSTCTALASAPDLPATTLASYCYQYMFQSCSHLVDAPVISATRAAT